MSADHLLYLCGPMTGLPLNNHPAFIEAADRLRRAGYLVVSPIGNGLLPDAPWISHMRADIAMMVSTCDSVATLAGCENSKGAQVEITLARGLGWTVASVDDWIEWAKIHRAVESELQP